MRTQGGYRFSLQFAADTEEQVRAGEFLERMGNRKSAIIVDALCRFLEENPKLESFDTKVKIQVNSPVKRQEIEAMIRSIIDEKLSESSFSAATGTSSANVRDALEEDISSMLSNLSMFG